MPAPNMIEYPAAVIIDHDCHRIGAVANLSGEAELEEQLAVIDRFIKEGNHPYSFPAGHEHRVELYYLESEAQLEKLGARTYAIIELFAQEG